MEFENQGYQTLCRFVRIFALWQKSALAVPSMQGRVRPFDICGV
jgi:hypothetical protein